MSFSWSTSSLSPFAGLKPATTNSFADALRRLAEHVEEKNKNSKFHSFHLSKIDTDSISTKVDANSGETSVLIQSSTDLPNRINPSYVNNSIPPEQALRLYTQYIQEVLVFILLLKYISNLSIPGRKKRRYTTILSSILQWSGWF